MVDVNKVQRLVKHETTNFMRKKTTYTNITHMFRTDIDRIWLNRSNETCVSMVEKCKLNKKKAHLLAFASIDFHKTYIKWVAYWCRMPIKWHNISDFLHKIAHLQLISEKSNAYSEDF